MLSHFHILSFVTCSIHNILNLSLNRFLIRSVGENVEQCLGSKQPRCYWVRKENGGLVEQSLEK